MGMSTSNAMFWPFGGVLEAMGMGDKPENKPAAIPEAPAVAPASVVEPAVETVAKAKETAQAAVVAKKRAATRSRSIYSSPLGLMGEASTVKKQLLGN